LILRGVIDIFNNYISNRMCWLQSTKEACTIRAGVNQIANTNLIIGYFFNNCVNTQVSFAIKYK